MTGSVIYRLPHEERCTYITGELRMLDSSTIMDSLKGYIIAPFLATSEEPVMHINADSTESFPCDDIPSLTDFDVPADCPFPEESTSKADYDRVFASFHDHIDKGKVQKIVLSRKENVSTSCQATPLQLFSRACAMYPRVMITMFRTPVSGLWLICSPEILVERKGSQWHTVALAGTMRWSEEMPEWDKKNRDEQHIVQTYITDVLRHFTEEISIVGPYTARAAHLAHIRSDISFSMPFGQNEGVVIRILHPTPAVCGLPRDAAYAIINNANGNRATSRHFYSGFSGPVCIDDSTHIYASLRCMQIHSAHQYTLHAGGGIMPDSKADSEWEETVAKMETMKNVLK